MIMNMEDFVFSSIYNYPSLYYSSSFEESKIRVLDHVFLVIGNGIEFIPEDGSFGPWCDKENYAAVDSDSKNRILRGDKLARLSKLDKSHEWSAFSLSGSK